MSEIGPLPGKGFHFNHRGLEIGIWMGEEDHYAGLGRALFLGHWAGQWVATVPLRGPQDDGAWAYDCQQAGGMGVLFFSPGLQAQIAFWLEEFYNFDPDAPQVQKTEPYTRVRFDNMLAQYLAGRTIAGQGWPVIEFKPYP